MEDVYRGLQKLMVVEISLDRDHDNPQLIFESRNSTGMDLSQADLIRNYVLMGLDAPNQTDLYNRYWFPMEERFGEKYGADFDYFMRDFLTLRSQSRAIPNIGKVYERFKQYRQERSEQPINDLVADIHEYASYYTRLKYEGESDPDITAAMRDINTLEVDVAYPFFLELYADYVAQRLSKAGLVAILRLVESYVFRRAICDIPTNSLNKTFATLARDLNRDRYLESVQAAFLLMDSYRRFPRDDEFRRKFTTRNIFDLTKRRTYLLAKLEGFDHKEPINPKDYTIEHIMPQNLHLSQEWREMLGPTWQEVQQRYLHTIGNLTLTAYNAELSDHPFSVKRDMKGGFRDSHLRLNADLAELDLWNQDEIEKRAQRLADQALRIWPAPALPPEALDRYRKSVTTRAAPTALSSLADLADIDLLIQTAGRIEMNGKDEDDDE